MYLQTGVVLTLLNPSIPFGSFNWEAFENVLIKLLSCCWALLSQYLAIYTDTGDLSSTVRDSSGLTRL